MSKDKQIIVKEQEIISVWPWCNTTIVIETLLEAGFVKYKQAHFNNFLSYLFTSLVPSALQYAHPKFTRVWLTTGQLGILHFNPIKKIV